MSPVEHEQGTCFSENSGHILRDGWKDEEGIVLAEHCLFIKSR